MTSYLPTSCSGALRGVLLDFLFFMYKVQVNDSPSTKVKSELLRAEKMPGFLFSPHSFRLLAVQTACAYTQSQRTISALISSAWMTRFSFWILRIKVSQASPKVTARPSLPQFASRRDLPGIYLRFHWNDVLKSLYGLCWEWQRCWFFWLMTEMDIRVHAGTFCFLKMFSSHPLVQNIIYIYMKK